MTHLTGPPRLNGILLPRPSIGAPMEAQWSPSESITTRRRGGRIVVQETRYRGSLRFGWSYCDPDLAAIIHGELQAPTVTLTPRTRATVDPEWAEEVTLDVRVTSDLPSVQQLATGTVPLIVEVETLQTYAYVPGSIVGGFYAAPIDGGLALTPYGEATITPIDPVDVVFGGQTYTLPAVRLGTPAVAALRARRDPARRVPTLSLDTNPAP